MKKLITGFAFLVLSIVLNQAVFADVKIKTRQTMSGQDYESTTYIKGKRERSERNMGGMESISITQCDLKRGIQIMPASKTYLVNNWGDVESVAPSTSVTKTQTPAQKQNGGVVTTTYTIKDTGERKKMFGYTARHLIITMESESSPDACAQTKYKMQTDGWYIDAEFALDCDYANYGGYQPPAETGGCRDKYVMKQNGTGKRGYPVYEKMTMFDESGKETYSFVNEVLEISQATLDASLFDLPAGYREVKNSSELYSSMSSQSSSYSSAGNSVAMNNSSSSKGSMKSDGDNLPTQNSPTELGAKKEGVVRVGLANIKVSSVSEGMNAEALEQVLEKSLAESLKNQQIEIVQLSAEVPSDADAEAKQKQCDFVVYANANYKKGGGGGMFGKMIGNVVAQTGGGSWGNTGANVAAAVAANAIVAATLAQNVKSKDEISLDLKVQTLENGTAVLAKQFKAKAKSDGEDIITVVVEQASQAIVGSVSKK